MPRIVNLGAPYGDVSFPDEASDEDVAATSDALEKTRQHDIKKARLQLEAANQEVERQAPTWDKYLTRGLLGFEEGAAGSTKQAVGNAVRTYTDAVAPETPYEQGTFRSAVQNLLSPTLVGGFLRFTNQPDNPEAPANVLRTAGKDIAQEGTSQMQAAQETGEQLGGGVGPDIIQSFTSSAGASAPAMLAAPFGLGAMSLAAGGQQYGSIVSQFTDKLKELHPELTDQQAYEKAQGPAAAAGIVTGLLTRGFGSIEGSLEKHLIDAAKGGATKATVTGILRGAFKSASLELPEEWFDQFWQGLVEKATIDPSKKIGDIVNDASLAGLSGFALGGITPLAIQGPLKAGEVIANKITEPSRMRRGAEARRGIIRDLVANEAPSTPGVPNAQDQVQATSGVPAVSGQPINTGPEGNVEGGTPLGASQDSGLPGGTVPNAPAEKVAGFGGYQFDDPNFPQYAVPGPRAGMVNHVSAATAQLLGYTVPQAIPSFQEWDAAGRPKGMPVAPAAPMVNRSVAVPLAPASSPISQLAQEFNATPVEDLKARQGKFGRGPTAYAWEIGSQATTPQDVATLRQMAQESAAKSEALRAQTKDPSVDPATKTQLFDQWSAEAGRQSSEAYEFATGVKLDGTPKWETFEKMVPGYKPAVPDAKWIAAHPTETAKSAVSPQSLQQQAASPANIESFATWDAAGNSVVDIPKLTQEIKSRNLTGGSASDAILLHLLQTSENHPVNPIQLIHLSPSDLQAISPPGSAAASGAYHGLFQTTPGSRAASVEILTKGSNGEPVTQAELVRVLTHELVHNNITSKIYYASNEVKQRAFELFFNVKASAKDTIWDAHNATTNIDEFYAEALSNPGFQKFLTGLDYSGQSIQAPTNVRNSAFGNFLGIIKRILKLPDFITTSSGQKVDVITALDEVVSVSHELESVRREAPELPAVAASPASPAIGNLQVAGGVAEVGRIAEQIVRARESATAALEGLAYERAQFKTARNELRRLSDLATGRFTQQGIDPATVDYPNPEAGVGIVDGEVTADPTFSEALTQVGIAHDPDMVRSHQQEIFFEQGAKRFNDLRARIATLQQARTYYQQLGVDESEIAKIDKSLTGLEAKASNLGASELNGQLIMQRAQDIRATEAIRQERLGKRAALSLDPVSDFFGREVGGYRAFSDRLAQAQDLAKSLRDEKTNISEWMRLHEDVEGWLNIPDDVRKAIRTGTTLTDEQRSAIFSALGSVFEDYDITAARMNEVAAARIPEIDGEIKGLLKKIASSKVESGTGEVMVADVLATLDGESGLTGNLQSLQDATALQGRISAINSFAMRIGQDVETNRALFDWLTDPTTTPPPVAPGTPSGGYGVDAVTLQMILREVKRSPAFGSAVLTLIDSANRKMANLPVAQLQGIEEALKLGTPEGQQLAEELAGKLMVQARSRTTLANSALRGSLKALDKLQIERRSLQDGQSMFRELSDSPDFQATREAINNSPYGLVEPMLAQNNTETTYLPFGAPGIPSHPGLVLTASDNPVLKAGAYHKIDAWRVAGQEYLDAYAIAKALYDANPAVNPSPATLGFDLPKVRGLQDAIGRQMLGSFQEISLLSENKRWKIPRLVREMSKSFWFRQHDTVAKLVGGTSGTDLRSRLGDYVNHYLIAQSVKDKYQDIPDKLHAALRSHPEVQMNIQNYREIWNEMAHWGRMFGSPVRVGFVLPGSGRVVTQADITLLHKQREFENELRRRVTETNPTQGIRLDKGGRTLVRPGAFVGDEGLPRHLNRNSETFIADVRAAYGSPVTGFDPTTDLGPASAHPIVSFWNGHVGMLVDHVLDSRRQDRDMRLTGPMQSAEMETAADWIVSGVPAIQSLSDLVDALVAHYPPAPGVNVRDEVINGLNAELRQYRDAAQRIAADRAEKDQSRHSKVSISFSADNEFTRPAAKLELPSSLYDYGALTASEHMLIASRANHERIVGYATAIQRAIGDLQDRLTRYGKKQITEKEAAQSYGGNINDVVQAIELLRRVAADFEAAHDNGNPATKQSGWWREGFGLLTSAVLALPPVGIRNMIQGQFAVYAMSRAMGIGGHIFTVLHTMKNIGKTVTRMALHIGQSIVRQTNLGAAMLTGTNRHIFEDLVGRIGELLTGPDFRTSQLKVGELGMDGRREFLQQLKRIWQEASEFDTQQEQDKAWKLWGTDKKLASVAVMPVRIIRAMFDELGVQNYDFAINTSALNYADMMSKRLEEVAWNYGTERNRQGLTKFDPLNPAWQLKPSEWAAFLTDKANEDSLAFFRLFLEGSASPEGFQLEDALWRFYQNKSAGKPATIFTPRQMDAVRRKWLAEVNASTPENRQSASSGSAVIRNMLALQGYSSDLLMKLINTSWGAAKDRSELGKLITKLPTLLLLALMSVLIGYVSGAATGLWEKKIRGRVPSLADPLDRDFWTSFKRWGSGTFRLGAVQIPYLGDFILNMRSEVQNGKGFDPAGRLLTVSLVARAISTVAGVWNTYKGAGTLRDALVPIGDTLRSMTPFWLEAEKLFSSTMGSLKQAERILRGEAQIQGLMEGKSGFSAPSYGPTTVVRRNLGDAISQWYEMTQKGDTVGAAGALARAQEQLQKLEDYHYAKYIADGKPVWEARQKAKADAWNDYQDINPAVAAMMGKRPTQAQYELLRKGTTGDRGAIVEQGITAWQAGAQKLFGKQGAITREDIAAARAGFGKPLPGMPRVGLRFPSTTPRRFGTMRGAGGTAAARVLSGPAEHATASVRRSVQAPLKAVRSSLRRSARIPRGRNPVARVRREHAPALRAGTVRRVPTGLGIGTRRRRKIGSRSRRAHAIA